MSSGAKKVEALGDDRAQTSKKTVKADSAAEKRKSGAAQQAVQAEKEAADARFEAAKARAAKKEAQKLAAAKEKQDRLTQKLEARQKKEEARAQSKSEHAEKLAARAARRQMLASESEAERRARRNREKRARLASRRQKQEAREQKVREKQEARRKAQEKHSAQRSNKKSGGKKRAPGIGGWIAAVSVLGAACLALATVVTAGYFRMNDMAMQSANGYRATLYELVSVSEGMDDDFAKLEYPSNRDCWINRSTDRRKSSLSEIDASDHVLGGKAVQVSASPDFPADGLLNLSSVSMPLPQGRKYRFSYWIKADGEGAVRAAVGGRYFTERMGTEWKKVAVEFESVKDKNPLTGISFQTLDRGIRVLAVKNVELEMVK